MEKELDKKYRILVVDDEEDICEILKFNLEIAGYDVETAANAEEALLKLRDGFHLILLDIMMDGISGLKMVQLLREDYKSDIPVIFLSALDTEADILSGFDKGGDDYIPKPFSPREMVARVKAVFRRIDGMQVDKGSSAVYTCRDIKIFPTERKVVKVSGESEFEITLTAMEYDFIFFMVSNKNRVFTRSQLLTNIWDYQYIGDTRAVDDLVKRIRKKLDAAATDFCIETVWGYGYKVTDGTETSKE